MMLVDIFKEFINVVQENKKYTIGLLNEEGIVVSCSREKFVGECFNVDSSDINNVFYAIKIKRESYGYIWVRGEDENLKMISSLLLDSLTTRLMYEINNSSLKQKVTKDDELIKFLLNEEQFDLNNILDLINRLGIDENKTRAAIYIINQKGHNLEEIMRLKLRADSKQMIYSLLNKRSLLLFKDMPSGLDNTEAKRFFKKYIRSLQDWGLQGCYYIVGSVQDKLKQYSISYKNCLWLEKNINYEVDEPIFFTDYLFEYFVSKIHLDDVRNIFDFYNDRGKGIDIDEFTNIANKLLINDYNITQTADDLFLHKNTLIYKLKKYEQIFNIDIRGDFKGKFLMVLIANTLREYQRQKQVGEKI